MITLVIQEILHLFDESIDSPTGGALGPAIFDHGITRGLWAYIGQMSPYRVFQSHARIGDLIGDGTESPLAGVSFSEIDLGQTPSGP